MSQTYIVTEENRRALTRMIKELDDKLEVIKNEQIQYAQFENDQIIVVDSQQRPVCYQTMGQCLGSIWTTLENQRLLLNDSRLGNLNPVYQIKLATPVISETEFKWTFAKLQLRERMRMKRIQERLVL